MKEFTLFDPDEAADPLTTEELVASLEPKCSVCRLGFLKSNEQSAGFFFEGNLNAKVAALADSPYPLDVLTQTFLGQPAGNEWQKWILTASLDHHDRLGTYLVQCKTPEVEDDAGEKVYKPPAFDEIAVCFPFRALAVLQAMPNLEVVVTLGSLVAKTLLQTNTAFKYLEGNWYGSDLLPGVAIYCLANPREVVAKNSVRQKGRIGQLLEFLENEYVQSDKILSILKAARLARETERQLYVL